MKARLHPTTAMQKAIDAYAEAKIQGIQSSAQEAVMKERSDIATSAAGCFLTSEIEKESRERESKMPRCFTGSQSQLSNASAKPPP